MKKNYASILMAGSLFAATAISHAQTYSWAKKMGSSTQDEGRALAVDNSGNVYLGGIFTGTADFDPSNGTLNLTALGGTGDIFIAKYSANGALVWAKPLGGSGNEELLDLKTDAQGNLYITGYFEGTVDFDGGPNQSNRTVAGGSDIFLAKYGNSGNLLWVNVIGGTSFDVGRDLAFDLNGNIVVAGSFSGANVDFDPGNGTANLSGTGQDVFVATYDPAGNYLNAFAFGGGNADYANAVEVSSTGNYIVGGAFQFSADFDPTGGTNTINSVGLEDVFIASFTPAGNPVFAKTLGSTQTDDLTDLELFNDEIFITGYFQGQMDFDPGNGTSNLTPGGSSDAFYAKYTSNGNYVFAFRIGGTGSDGGSAISFDYLGNAHLLGYFSGSNVDFDPSGGSATLNSSGQTDIFLARYDNNGGYIGRFKIGSNGSENPTDVYTTVNNVVHITGKFANTADFDPSGSTNSLTSTGQGDIFLAQYVTPCTPAGSASIQGGGGTHCSGAQVNLTASGTLNDSQDWFWYADSCAGTLLATGPSFTTTPLQTTTYYVRGEGNCLSANCNSVQVTIGDNTNPTVTCASNQTICTPSASGLSAILLADNCGNPALAYSLSGATSGSGSGDATNVSFLPGATTVTYTVTDGAGNTAQCSTQVSYTPVDNSVTLNGNTLTANGTGTYQWINCSNNQPIQGQTQASYSPAQSGSYAVIITTGGCSDTSNCTIAGPLGTENTSPEMGMTAGPNPVQSTLWVSFAGNPYTGLVQLFDLTGKVIWTRDVKNITEFSIDMQEFSSGSYILIAGSKHLKIVH